jgi:alpha-glucosidase
LAESATSSPGTEKFPAPKALTRAFADAGMKVVANVKPCLLDDHPRYAEVAAVGGFIAGGDDHMPLKSQFWDAEGAHVDFTNPAGVAWWKAGLTRELLDFGVDAGWNDNNEYGLWDDDATCAGFGEPTPLALMRPVQALLMTRATRDAQLAARPNVRPFVITRAGGPGLQRCAQTWSGDNTTSWDSLKWNFRTGLGMSLSGIFNIGHDVGGFAGPTPDPELLIRWTQAGLLHPRFLMNSWKGDGVTTSPWLHPEALPAIRQALRLRLRLMPYLYSAMAWAHEAHVAVLAPTFVVFEDDPACFADADSAMAPACLPHRFYAAALARSMSISRAAPKAGAISGPGASTRPVGARRFRRRLIGCRCLRRPEQSSPRPTAATIIRACTTSPRGRDASFRASARASRTLLCLKTTAYLSSAPRPA